MAVDKYFVLGNSDYKPHSYTAQIADEYYFYKGGANCCEKIWYYYACEHCYEKSLNQVWESNYYGSHSYGTLVPAQGEIHTPTELKAGVAAYYFCDVCDTYFDEAYIETTLAMLTGAKPEHSYTSINGYKGADGHANTCACGAKSAIVGHTPNIEAPTEAIDKYCITCGYVIAPALGHTHNHTTQKYDASNHWMECACGDKKDVTAHSASADDGNCLTAITCKNCPAVVTAAKTAHTPGADDNNCSTAIVCSNPGCTAVTTAAKAHAFTGEWQKDKDGHWHICANNGCTVTDSKADHISGGAATETTDEVCTACGYVITASAGHVHNHTTQKYDASNHWMECACGDKKDAAAHTGGAATCTAKAKCSTCGAEYGAFAEHTFVEGKCECGETDPNYQPPHTHTFVEGKCECGETDPNYQPPHTHTFVEGKCECGETDPNYQPPHTHTFVEGKCECGETDPNYVPDEDDGLGAGAIIGIVIGAIAVLGGGGFALYHFVFKKKRI